MHDGLQKSFDGPAVEPLAVQRHSFHLTSCRLRVDRIRELDLTSCTRRLAAQDLEDIRRQDIATD